MHNFIEKFTKINDICKKFAGNRVNEHGNVSRRGVIPTFSDLEVIALSLTAEAFAALIDKVSGRGTWKSNPWVVVYEFELVK